MVRRWIRVACVVVVVGGLAAAGRHAAGRLQAAPFLAVSEIAVDGNNRLSEDDVLTLLDGISGVNILSVDLDRQRRRLLTSPWLQDGTLRRVLPSTIEVVVRERLPVALARIGDRLFLIDRAGVVIDQHGPRFADLNLPIVDGLAPSGALTPKVDPTRMALAVRLLDQLSARPEALAAVSQIDVNDPFDAVVLLDDDPALLHLGGDRFLERLRSYAELAPALRERVADIDYVDLRFEPRVYVRPVGGTAPVSRGVHRLVVAPAATQ